MTFFLVSSNAACSFFWARRTSSFCAQAAPASPVVSKTFSIVFISASPIAHNSRIEWLARDLRFPPARRRKPGLRADFQPPVALPCAWSKPAPSLAAARRARREARRPATEKTRSRFRAVGDRCYARSGEPGALVRSPEASPRAVDRQQYDLPPQAAAAWSRPLFSPLG